MKNKNNNWFEKRYNQFISKNFWKRTKEMEVKLENALNKL